MNYEQSFKFQTWEISHIFWDLKYIDRAPLFFVKQQKYLLDLLTNSGLAGVKPGATPLSVSPNFNTKTSLFDDPQHYRQLVWALQYLMFTWPDISFAANKVSQFMSYPAVTHFSTVKRILRYLYGTQHFGISFNPSPLSLTAYCDAN